MTHLVFFKRRYPSANSVLLHGPSPVLVDTGFGSDADVLEQWLRAQGVAPDRLSLIVNTHHRSDHVGGNFRLQSRYGIPIAAHRLEAALVNARDPEACRARWLDQPVEPYQVQRPLLEGDVIDTGALRWEVLHTPGHTLGHVSLYAKSKKLLLLGDALHGDDVGWLNPHKEGGRPPPVNRGHGAAGRARHPGGVFRARRRDRGVSAGRAIGLAPLAALDRGPACARLARLQAHLRPRPDHHRWHDGGCTGT
jgi:hypothetical protein